MEAEPRRKLYFTSQGFRSQEIVVAPELDDSQSKRKPLIAQEDVTLDENIHDLDDGTKRRNRAFQERIDSIWRSTAGWEAKLKTEAKEAVETILNMKDNYAAHISDFRRSLFSEVNEIFDKVDNQSIPSEIDRADVIDKNAAVFVAQTVPDTIERQSGEVSRQLRRTYETFDIEKKKELKRCAPASSFVAITFALTALGPA